MNLVITRTPALANSNSDSRLGERQLGDYVYHNVINAIIASTGPVFELKYAIKMLCSSYLIPGAKIYTNHGQYTGFLIWKPVA